MTQYYLNDITRSGVIIIINNCLITLRQEYLLPNIDDYLIAVDPLKQMLESVYTLNGKYESKPLCVQE